MILGWKRRFEIGAAIFQLLFDVPPVSVTRKVGVSQHRNSRPGLKWVCIRSSKFQVLSLLHEEWV